MKQAFVPHRISDLLYEVSKISDCNERDYQLNCFVERLEEEIKKIDAFKRELPLCMLLLNDAIDYLREEIRQCAPCGKKRNPVLEEFIPLAQCEKEVEESSVNERKDSNDKKEWMSSAQLWNANSKEPDRLLPKTQQTCRKQRRCWSSELHRSFLNALQQLGGCQAATPKQIRELMQVDGLTNDEVKSHLQKYRLHSSRVPANGSACFKNLWSTKNPLIGSSIASSSHSGSPQGPFQFAARSDSIEDDDDSKPEKNFRR